MVSSADSASTGKLLHTDIQPGVHHKQRIVVLIDHPPPEGRVEERILPRVDGFFEYREKLTSDCSRTQRRVLCVVEFNIGSIHECIVTVVSLTNGIILLEKVQHRFYVISRIHVIIFDCKYISPVCHLYSKIHIGPLRIDPWTPRFRPAHMNLTHRAFRHRFHVVYNNPLYRPFICLSPHVFFTKFKCIRPAASRSY